MSFRGVGNAANEAQMASFAMAGALGFEGLLRESKNPGADVHDFCKK